MKIFWKNKLLKVGLTVTAFCPALLVYGLNELLAHEKSIGWLFLIFAASGVALHYGILQQLHKKSIVKLKVTEITPTDHKLMAYVVGYFIPILKGELLSGYHILIIGSVLFLIVLFSNATTYNPMHFFFGYNYYDIKDGQSLNKTIVSKSKLISIADDINVVELSYYNYIKKS